MSDFLVGLMRRATGLPPTVGAEPRGLAGVAFPTDIGIEGLELPPGAPAPPPLAPTRLLQAPADAPGTPRPASPGDPGPDRSVPSPVAEVTPAPLPSLRPEAPPPPVVAEPGRGVEPVASAQPREVPPDQPTVPVTAGLTPVHFVNDRFTGEAAGAAETARTAAPSAREASTSPSSGAALPDLPRAAVTPPAPRAIGAVEPGPSRGDERARPTRPNSAAASPRMAAPGQPGEVKIATVPRADTGPPAVIATPVAPAGHTSDDRPTRVLDATATAGPRAVHVHIGTVEVRAPAVPAVTRAPAAPPAPGGFAGYERVRAHRTWRG